MEELVVPEKSKIQRNINLLSSPEKFVRRNALLDISKELFGEDSCLVNEEELDKIFCDISINLLKTLSDESEMCRETGISLIRNFVRYLPVNEKYLSKVMPYLYQRIGNQKIIEPSEEIRLLLLQFLSLIIRKYEKLLNPYLNELVLILSNNVLDPYPVVKRESCECISLVANSLSKQFHMQSESLVKPTLKVLTHQHYKVRLSAVNAINDIIRYGNSKSVDDVIGPLAERLFDSNPTVRLAIARAAGNWLLNFPDRYSYFHKFLPLILTCIMDEIPDVRDKANEYWESAGAQYESENDEELKDEKNFDLSKPIHYPEIERPRLGCRTIVKNNFSKILPALINELGDWTPEVRLKSAYLLYQLILHMENSVTMNLEKVLTGMYFAAGDEEESIVKQVEKSAELLGYFVPPDVYCSLILPAIQNSPSAAHLQIFASILLCSTRSSLSSELVTIANVLCKQEICYNLKSRFQKNLIKCCSALIRVCVEDCCSISSQLFIVALSVKGLSSDSSIFQSCDEILSNLQQLEKFSSSQELFEKYMGPLLEQIIMTAEGWHSLSPEKLIFETFMRNSGLAFVSYWDSICKVYKMVFKPESDPEVKLKLLTLLSDVLTNNESALQSLSNPTSSLLIIVKEGIFPNLQWKAGRTASAIRTAALSCLLSCILHLNTLSAELISSDPTYFATLISLVEDDSHMTRELTLHCLCKVFEECCDKMSPEEINKASDVIVHRLDDVNDSVRRTSLEALTLLFTNLPKDYEVQWHKNHLLSIFSTVLVHMDDPDEQFAGIVLVTLKSIGKLIPQEFYEKVSNSRNNFRNVKECENLLEHLKRINISQTD